MKRSTLIYGLLQKILLIGVLSLNCTLGFAIEPLVAIATISFTRGSSAATLTDQAPRILGKGTEIYLGDNIQTSERSFVIITFNDGAKITVRPNSSFSITEYSNSREKQAELTLHKGGVRASTGEIAQQNPDNYRIKTPYATIQAQQADYSVRICQKDCELEANEQLHKEIRTTDTVVARVVKIKGLITAENKKSQKKQQIKLRRLAIGAPLYAADHLKSQKNSFALLAFRDGGRITLQANSEFDIDTYRYQQATKTGRAVFNLLKGGLRALTGHIGKVNHADYQINTPVATIGIRGTGFDLFCKGDCVNEGARQIEGNKSTRHLTKGQMEGLYSTVWQGVISQTTSQGTYELKTSESNYISNMTSQPLTLKKMPQSNFTIPAPRPDKEKVDEKKLFGRKNQKGTPEGVYVSVHDGHVQLIDDKAGKLDLGKDEAGYINRASEFIRLEWQQNFQINDQYPLPSKFDEQQGKFGDYSILAENHDNQKCVIE